MQRSGKKTGRCGGRKNIPGTGTEENHLKAAEEKRQQTAASEIAVSGTEMIEEWKSLCYNKTITQKIQDTRQDLG